MDWIRTEDELPPEGELVLAYYFVDRDGEYINLSLSLAWLEEGEWWSGSHVTEKPLGEDFGDDPWPLFWAEIATPSGVGAVNPWPGAYYPR